MPNQYSESKYQAGFGVIILGQNPLIFMIPIYSTTVLYDEQNHYKSKCNLEPYEPEVSCFNRSVESLKVQEK